MIPMTCKKNSYLKTHVLLRVYPNQIKNNPEAICSTLLEILPFLPAVSSNFLNLCFPCRIRGHLSTHLVILSFMPLYLLATYTRMHSLYPQASLPIFACSMALSIISDRCCFTVLFFSDCPYFSPIAYSSLRISFLACSYFSAFPKKRRPLFSPIYLYTPLLFKAEKTEQ